MLTLTIILQRFVLWNNRDRVLKYLLSLIFVGFIFLSCNEDAVSPSGRNYEIPSTVGSYWKYTVYDSSTTEHDTVEVSIISSVGFFEGKVTHWTFFNTKTADTTKVVFSGDSTDAALYSFSQKYRLLVLSPLREGMQYNSIYGPMQVQTIENVTNEFKFFTDCYRIYNPVVTSSEVNITTYWIKPGIGIVKAHRSSIGGQLEQEVYWDLIDYNIVD